MYRRHLIVLLAIAAVASAPRVAIAQVSTTASPTTRSKPAQLPADSAERAHRYIGWLLESRSDSLFANLDSLSKKQVGSPAALDKMALEIAARAGTQEKPLEERWVTRNGHRQFWHTGKFSLMEEPLMVRVVILPSGQIAGFGFNPAGSAPPVDP